MGSLHKRGDSRFYWAAFELPGGRRAFRSTKCLARKDAMQVLTTWEKASAMGKAGTLTETKVREVVAAIYLAANQEAMPSASVREYLAAWLKRKGLELAESSAGEYRRVVDSFLEHMGDRADRGMDTVRVDDILQWRSGLVDRVTPATANKCLKILRTAWAQALKDQVVSRNIVLSVDTIKTRRTTERRAFTLDELRSILDVSSNEWRGIILTGLYTGQRMADVVLLTWNQIDMVSREIHFNTRKTGARLTLPIAEPLHDYLMSLAAGDDPNADVFPDQAEAMRVSGSTVSRRFMGILEAAGVIKKGAGHVNHAATGKGRSARRNVSEVSFHALRHTATSLLKNMGVSDVVARSIVGHESEAISRVYTHIDASTLRSAVDKMPDVTKRVKE
jgi:integrase